MRFRRLLPFALSVLLLTAWGVPAEAAPPIVISEPSTLPLGPAPALPYINVAAKKIADGTRRVDISGLAGTLLHLHKVDGGYVVGRVGRHAGLAFISSSGARSSITGDWYLPLPEVALYEGLQVSVGGDRIVFNTAQLDDPDAYRDTVVMEVPSRRILYRRTFSVRPTLLGFDGERVFLGVGLRALWWTPGRLSTGVLNSNVTAKTADLSARQYVGYAPNASDQLVASIPPRATSSWPAAIDAELGVWSPDDLRIAGTAEVTAGTDLTEVFLIDNASDGASLLSVVVLGVPQISWETNSTVLIMARTGDMTHFQLIRCTLAGACERVGPVSPTKYGPYVIVNRRNS